ncbi:m18 protein [Murid betaherpesvirus 1]|uniref:M18 protein n=1 Tax=Murid herpesvirus 1 TaxID=10366 RepID=H2A326_MUHV1|nr:m18 protein [Murid betaherpesvirus 1]
MADTGHGTRTRGSRVVRAPVVPVDMPSDGSAAAEPVGGNNSTARSQRQQRQQQQSRTHTQQQQQQQQQEQQQVPTVSVVTTATTATVFDSSAATGWIRVSSTPFGSFVPTPPLPQIQSPAPTSWTTLLTPAPSPTPPHAPVFLGYAPHLGWPHASAFQPLPGPAYATFQPFPWLPAAYPTINPLPLDTSVYDFSQPTLPPPPTPTQFILPFGIVSPFGSGSAVPIATMGAPPTPVPTTLIASSAVPPAPPPTPAGNVPILPRPERETETPPERPPRCSVRPPGRTTPVAGRSRSPVARGKKKAASNNNLLNGGPVETTTGSRKAAGGVPPRQKAASAASSSSSASSSGPSRGRIISVSDPNLGAVSSSSSQMWATAAVVQPFGVVDQFAPGQQGQQQHSHHTQVQQQQMHDQQYQQHTRHRVTGSGRSGGSGRAGMSHSSVGGGGGEDGSCDNLFLGSPISSDAKTNVSFSSSPLLSLLLDSVIDSGTFDDSVVGESGTGGEDATRDGRGGGGGGNVGLGGDDNTNEAPPLLGGVAGEVVGVESEPSGSALRVVGGDDAPSLVPSSGPFEESGGCPRSRSSTIASDSTTTDSESKWALRSCGSFEGEPSNDQKRSGIERASPARVGFRPIGATPSDASSRETTPERRGRKSRLVDSREPSSSDSSRERPADDTANIPSRGGPGGSSATEMPATRLRRSLPPSSRSDSTSRSPTNQTSTTTTPSSSPIPKRSRGRRTTVTATCDPIVPAPISRRRQSLDGRPSAATFPESSAARLGGNPRPVENGVITRDRAKRDGHPLSKPLHTPPRKKKPPRSPEAQQQSDDDGHGDGATDDRRSSSESGTDLPRKTRRDHKISVDEGTQKKHKTRSPSKGNERAKSPAAMTAEDEPKDTRGPGFVQRNLRRVASRVAREAAKRPLLPPSPLRPSTPQQQLVNPNNSLSRHQTEDTGLEGGFESVVSAAPDTTSGGEEEEVDEIEAAEALSDALALLKGPGDEDDPLGDAVVPDGMTGVARVVEVVSDYDVECFAEILNDEIGGPLWWDD